MAGVRFDAVGKRFGSVEAVRDLSLEIADGEFMVLVGPSGSGKTTALRMLAGLEAITSGTISIGEKVVNKVAPRERDIAGPDPLRQIQRHIGCERGDQQGHRDDAVIVLDGNQLVLIASMFEAGADAMTRRDRPSMRSGGYSAGRSRGDRLWARAGDRFRGVLRHPGWHGG